MLGAFTGMNMYVCSLHLRMHALSCQLQGQLLWELCSGRCRWSWRGQASGWYPAAPPYWELCVHLILCQPGLSPGAEKCPKSQNVPGTGKAFPTLL